MIFTFTPAISVSLPFTQPVDYAIIDGVDLITGTAATVTFRADQRVEITLPPAFSDTTLPTPTFDLTNAFANSTVTTFGQDLSLIVMKLVAEEHVFDTRVVCGPVYEQSWPLDIIPNTTLFDGDQTPWPLAGFTVGSLRQIYLPLVLKRS